MKLKQNRVRVSEEGGVVGRGTIYYYLGFYKLFSNVLGLIKCLKNRAQITVLNHVWLIKGGEEEI